ncbi:MAG: 30S ribosomal protein S6 [Candidatus Zixiibacteriota bacterium]|nr:MAG: 30S ribosomal protein S6 [candidate division Zixibacteria bacterium]
MKLYELTIIINSSLEESAVQAEIEKIENQITSAEGKIHKLERWGVRRLTYLIKGFNQGFYAHFLYEGPAKLVSEIERALRINENILRYLTVQAVISPPKEKKKTEIPSEEPTPVEE